MSQSHEEKIGIIYTAFSYLLWGILPLYWKLLEVRPALEILAHRIIWSFLFMIGLLWATRQLKAWRHQLSAICRQPKLVGGNQRGCHFNQRKLVYIHMGGQSWPYCRDKFRILY
ncbi:hypothetical protein B4119_2265 [Parageobacillus caldoxylosilyticus]|uniref:EamA domain-containing protein n=1 Tax=Saccharococcus caldoxylosilyticus TaxID=81408 RepID=A0A150LUC3_9BACL|nr:hypothetical protein B4119_2265 [Parageobacillus caldoxylosilyticus]